MGNNDKLHKRNLKITNDKLAKFDKYPDKSKMPSGALEKFKKLQKEKQAYTKQAETNITADPRITKEIKEKKGPIKKGPIVSKKELAASGLSLRDYLNKQQNKTRRHGNTLVKGTAASNYKTDGNKDRNMGVVNTASASNNKDKKVNKKKTPMDSNDTANKKKISQVDSFSKSKVKQGPPKPPAKKPKKSLGSKFMGFLKGEGSKMKKDFNNAVSETKRNFGIAKKKKPVKKSTMYSNDTNVKKKKAGAAFYESNGGKIKMSKGYSKGGKIFTGR